MGQLHWQVIIISVKATFIPRPLTVVKVIMKETSNNFEALQQQTIRQVIGVLKFNGTGKTIKDNKIKRWIFSVSLSLI